MLGLKKRINEKTFCLGIENYKQKNNHSLKRWF
jgi:hypothetical protein